MGNEPSYEVSNDGEVRSVSRYVGSRWESPRLIPGKELTQFSDSYGYLVVKVRVGGRGVMKKVHRLVAEAFLPNPESKPQVNHKDTNKKNNRVDNLEWVTAKEHGRHSSEKGLRPRGSANGQAKLTEVMIPAIRARLGSGESMVSISKDYGVSPYPILCIKRGKTWKHV